jgi:hypothetical protein
MMERITRTSTTLRGRIAEKIFGNVIEEKVAERLLAAAQGTDCHAERMGKIERMRGIFRTLRRDK